MFKNDSVLTAAAVSPHTLAPATRAAKEATAAELWQQAHQMLQEARRALADELYEKAGTRAEQAIKCFTDPDLMALAREMAAAASAQADDFPQPPALQGWSMHAVIAHLAAIDVVGDRDRALRVLRERWPEVQEQQQAAGLASLPDQPLSKGHLTCVNRYFTQLRIRTTVRTQIDKRHVSGRRPKVKVARQLATEQLLNLAYNRVFYDLYDACPELTPPANEGPGAPRHFPPQILFIIAAGARAAGSHEEVQRLLRADHNKLWHELRKAAHDMGLTDLPTYPPTGQQVMTHYRYLAEPERLRVVLSTLCVLQVRQVQQLGNLLPGVEPDWAQPDYRHTITGDGTFWKLYSSQPLGPRAAKWHTNARADGKPSGGTVNCLAMHTWTPYGRFVLDVDWAGGAEQWPALDSVKRIVAAAGDGVHTLVYDRVFKGWLVEFLLAHYRIVVLNKSVGERKEASSADIRPKARVPRPRESSETAGSSAAVHDEFHSAGDEPSFLDVFREQAEAAARSQGLTVDSPGYSKHLRVLALAILAEEYSKPLPVGKSLYPTSGGDFDIVTSVRAEYGIVWHTLSDGTRCQHRLFVDDGALFNVLTDPYEDQDVKIGHADCTSATAVRPNDHSAWQLHMTWRIPCTREPFDHVIHWKPSRQQGGVIRTGRDYAISLLRPVNRMMTELFREGHGVRNITENHNRQAKYLAVPVPGRAASVTAEQHLLDWACFGLVNNSNLLDRTPLGSRPPH